MVITSMSNNHSVSPEIALSGVERPQGALAYDHKMLWRANLYIKEGNDWNDSHKWNSSDNDWNRTYNFDSFENNDFKISSLVQDGNGGQVIDIYPFTHTWQGVDDTNINDRVPYEYNGTDSPFAYMFKMDNQLKFLEDIYNGNGDVKAEDDTSSYGEYTAPYSLHKNYVFGASYPHGVSEEYAEDDVKKYSSDSLAIDSKEYHPYVPALESGMTGNYVSLSDTSGYNLPYNLPMAAGYGAGTDCLGFVTRSVSYRDNPYRWAMDSLFQPLWGNSRVLNDTVNGWPLESDGEGVLITSKSKQNVDLSFPDLEKIVPGDIFYYGEEDDPSHILIVIEVKYSGSDTRSLEATDIVFTESTFFTPYLESRQGTIYNYRTLGGSANYEGIKEKNWSALRLSK